MIATGFTVSSRTHRHPIFAITTALLLVFCGGCADEETAPSWGGGPTVPADPNEPNDHTRHQPEDDTPVYCEDGSIRSCKIVVGVNDGVEMCVMGVSSCDDGRWSDCTLINS